MELTRTHSQSGREYRIGYLAEFFLLRVVYPDGSIYDAAGVQQSEYDALMAHESKGSFLRSHFAHRLVRIQEVEHGRAVTKAPEPIQLHSSGLTKQGGNSGEEPPLNVMDEEADNCCRNNFRPIANQSAVSHLTQWTCKDCGLDFIPELVGPVRYWRVKAFCRVIR